MQAVDRTFLFLVFLPASEAFVVGASSLVVVVHRLRYGIFGRLWTYCSLRWCGRLAAFPPLCSFLPAVAYFSVCLSSTELPAFQAGKVAFSLPIGPNSLGSLSALAKLYAQVSSSLVSPSMESKYSRSVTRARTASMRRMPLPSCPYVRTILATQFATLFPKPCMDQEHPPRKSRVGLEIVFAAFMKGRQLGVWVT